MKVLISLSTSTIKVTVQLRNLDDSFFEGSPILRNVGLNAMSDREKLDYLIDKSQSMKTNVKLKIGNGQFNDRIDLNRKLRDANVKVDYSISDRKGYRLVTFIVG